MPEEAQQLTAVLNFKKDSRRRRSTTQSIHRVRIF